MEKRKKKRTSFERVDKLVVKKTRGAKAFPRSLFGITTYKLAMTYFNKTTFHQKEVFISYSTVGAQNNLSFSRVGPKFLPSPFFYCGEPEYNDLGRPGNFRNIL